MTTFDHHSIQMWLHIWPPTTIVSSVWTLQINAWSTSNHQSNNHLLQFRHQPIAFQNTASHHIIHPRSSLQPPLQPLRIWPATTIMTPIWTLQINSSSTSNHQSNKHRLPLRQQSTTTMTTINHHSIHMWSPIWPPTIIMTPIWTLQIKSWSTSNHQSNNHQLPLWQQHTAF
jgi:hypothetical protein